MMFQTVATIFLLLVMVLTIIVIVKELDDLVTKILFRKNINNLKEDLTKAIDETLEKINEDLEKEKPKATRKRKTKDE